MLIGANPSLAQLEPAGAVWFHVALLGAAEGEALAAGPGLAEEEVLVLAEGLGDGRQGVVASLPVSSQVGIGGGVP